MSVQCPPVIVNSDQDGIAMLQDANRCPRHDTSRRQPRGLRFRHLDVRDNSSVTMLELSEGQNPVLSDACIWFPGTDPGNLG